MFATGLTAGSHVIVDVEGLFLAMMDADHPDCTLRNTWRCIEMLQLLQGCQIIVHFIYHPLGLLHSILAKKQAILDLGTLAFMQYIKVIVACRRE